VRWAGFGLVLAEDIDQNYIYVLSSIKLTRTAPLVLGGILESDNHNSSFGQQQIKELCTIYIYCNIRIIALRGSKMATSYHDIGSRVKHHKTGIDDQASLTLIFLHGHTPRLTKSFVDFQIQSLSFQSLRNRRSGCQTLNKGELGELFGQVTTLEQYTVFTP
jgi:hypothetical protein